MPFHIGYVHVAHILCGGNVFWLLVAWEMVTCPRLNRKHHQLALMFAKVYFSSDQATTHAGNGDLTLASHM